MGDGRPKSPDGVAAFAGPGGYDRFIARLTTGDFGLARDHAGGLTYRAGWDSYVAPWLESMKGIGAGSEAPATSPSPGAGRNRQAVSSDYLNAQPASEANKLFDAMCGGRVYEGPRWWEDPKAHGIKVYNGKD